MIGNFLACLAVTLSEETGYPQRGRGPYLRHANGSTTIPDKPDGRFFDDDPDDTGGRTGCGILQREYDAWRRSEGLGTQDVWRIGDAEIQTIYHLQYWEAVQGDRLPPGVDLMVFDLAVNCGVGTAIRCLQRALGVKADGHLGQVTLDAASSALAIDLIEELRQRRAAYHRQCKTFWKHGKGWLARTDRVAAQATRMVGPASLAAAPTPALDPEAVTPPKAVAPAPAESMAGSSTGNAAIGISGSGLAGVAVEVGQAAKRITESGKGLSVGQLLIEMTASLSFWLAAGVVLAAVYVWFERRRHMQQA
jgi:lysozyme family protein